MSAATPAVVGLDLSITATGAANQSGVTGTWKTRSDHGDARLAQIAQLANVYCAKAELVVIEGPVVRSSAAVIIGMVHGAVRYELQRLNVPYVIVPPATLKKFATGRGNADKTAMAMAAYKRAGIEFDDDNQCDAWWLRAAGLHALGAPLFDLPAAQVDALAKVTWPAREAA